MELNNTTLHVFVSLVLILIAAAVAMLCDVLKGNVERLREQLSQLRAMQAEAGLLAAPTVAAAALVPGAAHGISVRPGPHVVEPPARPAEAPAPQRGPGREALERGAALASVSGGRSRAPKRELSWAAPDELQQFALVGPRKRAHQERTASPEPAPVVEQAPVSQPPAPPRVETASQFPALPQFPAPPQVDAPPQFPALPQFPAPPQEETAETPVAEHKLPERNLVVVHRATDTPKATACDLPRGIGDRAALARLKRATDPFTGTVTVIAADNYWRACERLGRSHADELMRQAARMIEGLAGERDWLCRSAEDELVLVSPDTALAAKQRLDQLAERLWDLQLSNLGNSTISFAWGSAQAHQELLSDVLAEAQSRMEEGRRRNRMTGLHTAAKIAVNE